MLPIGKARIARAGKDVTIVSFSMGMRYATQATEKLVAAGVDVELIDLRTLRPMDSDTVVESVKKTGRLVTVEEGWPQGGIGAELASRVGHRGVRLPRRADHPRHRQGRADALCGEPREAGAAQRRRSRRGGERRDVQELTMAFGKRNTTSSDTPSGSLGAKELPIPGPAFGNPDAQEMLRAWSISGGLQVSMQRNFDDPAVWGLLLTDIARHAARIYARETTYSEDEALKRIKDLFEAEMAKPTDLGTTGRARQ